MITELRDRTRADRFANDVRQNQRKRRNRGRFVYLAAVLALFVWLLDMLVGSYVRLRAEGLVVSDYAVVASPYEVQVVDVRVAPGQRVRRGDVLAVVTSPRISELIATLTARQAETTARLADLAIRLEVTDALMQAARQRLADTTEQLERVNRARGETGFVSDAFVATIQRDHYAALMESVSREAESRTARKLWEELEATREEARLALDTLRADFDDGVIRAGADAIVGPNVVRRGDVINPGDHLMALYSGEKYALVYLETGTLYAVRVGDRVEVSGGFTQTSGRIVEVLPLSVPLPSEFQRAFRPPARGQVARIALDEAERFPIAAPIAVRGDQIVPGFDFLTRSRLSAFAGEAVQAMRAAFGSEPEEEWSVAGSAQRPERAGPTATGAIPGR